MSIQKVKYDFFRKKQVLNQFIWIFFIFFYNLEEKNMLNLCPL